MAGRGTPSRIPSSGDDADRRPDRPAATDRRRLHLAFAASFLLHAIVLSITFGVPQVAPKLNTERALEVVLVNARHARAPEKPDALAQANLDGGGSGERDARPKTPLPPQPARRDGDALVDAGKRSAPVEAPKKTVTTRPKAEASVARTPRPEQAPPAPERAVSGLDLLNSAAAVARVEAEIDRHLDEYASRPRRKTIGAQTKEYRFAQYVEDWRQKVERVGTLNYPDAARGKLYGSLLLLVAIRPDGSIARVEVRRSSGQPILDEAAKRIVHLAAPFAPFPSDIRKDVDILEIARTWTFTNADRVTAN